MPVRAAPNDLQTAPLIGRDDLLAAVRPLFRDPGTRLITITGPAGVGKTRIANELLAVLGEPAGRECVTIDLTTVHDPDSLDAELARAALISAVGEESIRHATTRWLTGRRAIILLDNAEHIPGIGPRVAEWLAIAPDLRVIVTSRKRLNLSFETELELQPLDTTPVPDKNTLSTAARLFAIVAGSDHPDQLPAETRNLIEQVVHRLEGLPLSIELTAAQIQKLDAEHLTDLLINLDAMARSLPTVASALDVAVARSYSLLSPPARTLLRYLTVFTGGFTYELVEHLVDHAPALDAAGSSVADLLDELSALHLVLLQSDERDNPRFVLLSMVAESINRHRDHPDETEAARAAHASAVLEFASSREYAGLRPGQEHEVAELSTNFHNIMAAITWLHEQDRPADLLRLVGALTWTWYSQGHYAHGLHQFERVVALDPPQEGRDWARFKLGHGVLLDITGRFEEGRDALQASIAAYDAAGATDGVTVASIALGFNAYHLGMYDEAQAALERAIANARSIPEREFGNSLEAIALANLGTNAHERGDLATAEMSLRRAVEIHDEMRFQWGAARGLCDLGGVLRDAQQHAEALATYQRALEIAQNVNDHRLMAVALSGIATILINDEQYRMGAWIFGGVAALRPIAGKPSFLRANALAWEQASERARFRLTPTYYDLAWNAGGRAPLRELIHTARNAILFGPNPFPQPSRPLTRQERYVLRIVLQDQTTSWAAEVLGVSERTVGSHIASIFRKYGVNSRLELIALVSHHRRQHPGG